MPADEPFDTSTHDELQLMQGFPPPTDKQVNRSNGLWVPPYNRWAYQNMRQIWPSTPVRPAPKASHIPRNIDPAIGRITVLREDGTAADFDTFLRQTFTDSLIVITKGQIVYERYLNGMTADQPHIMFSCTKSFIGLFALMEIEAGLVSEQTPITDILPELKGSGFAGATFGQVMDMTASIKFSEDYADPEAEIHDYGAVLGAGVKAGSATALSSLYAFAETLQADPNRPHGTIFDYQTPQADVLSWAVCRLTGKSFIDTLESRIWSKLGTEGDTYVLMDPSGIIFAGGGLNATANDLARFAVMALAGGRFEDAQVVASSIFDTIAKGGSTAAFLKGPSASEDMANGHWSYRAQWWVRNVPGHEAFMALGVNGQWIYIDRARDVAVIKQSSQPEADSWYFQQYTTNAIDAMIRHITGA